MSGENPAPSDHISEYERQRLENMRQNAELMASQMASQGAGGIARIFLEQQTRFMNRTGTVPSDVHVDSHSEQEHSSTEAEPQLDVQNIVITEETNSRVTSSKAKNRRRRGPSKGVVKYVGQTMILEWDPLCNPVGDWAQQFGRLVGACAYRVDINVDSYFDLPEVERHKNWEEAKILFHIEEPDLAKKESKFHSLVASRFRNWKTKLRRRWLVKSADEAADEIKDYDPWVVYEGIIYEEQWIEFERKYRSEVFQAKSGRAKMSGRQNEHPHRMGQKSYYIAEQEWIKEGRLSPSPVSDSSTSTVDSPSSIGARVSRRPLLWKLAHEKKLSDGTWGIDPSAIHTQEIARKIDQQLQEEARAKADGTFIQEHGLDALAKAIGKRDHRGRVKGIGGVNVGIENVFGKSGKRGRRVSQEGMGSKEELKNTIKDQLREEMREELRMEMRTKIEREIQDRLVALEAALSKRFGLAPNAGDSTHIRTPPQPYRRAVQAPEVNRPCYLAILDGETGNLVLVADGTVYPYSSSLQLIHNEPAQLDHYRVSLDTPYPEHLDVDLPCPSKDGQTTKVGEARGHYLEWPVDQVVFKDGDEVFQGVMRLRVGKDASKSMVASNNAAYKRKTSEHITDESQSGHNVECESLAEWLRNIGTYEPPVITITPPLFYYQGEPHYLVIARVHLEEFLQGDCINVSILHVYQMYMMEEYSDFFARGFVSMLCPAKLDSAMAKREPGNYRAYLRDAFLFEMAKNENQCRFLLAPYNEGAHWMLFVIELQMGDVYVFNSIRSQNLRHLLIYTHLNLAFEIYKANGGKCKHASGKGFNFIEMKCALQPGNVECGYYVLKYMHEIVALYGDCANLKDDYFGGHAPYTTEEIDLIREQWANFFKRRWLGR